MQLSKLEIKGFKSFGDKVTLNFDQGITGIVGPNGCGKSNIVDAIRWVLGEQKTRALRSEKMENIIFNGTKNRKPLQMAEVSLTFNNTKNLIPTEYAQVTITRRYYRSGESEYLLNGVTCRLKDITNLFLDTGIGSDSYAIIELKMVDDLLNDKDNSRRNLFEEAAGISKFKLRKRQTLKKLEDTDKDLERVEDVLFEIEKNLKSLERQAKQAEKYKTHKEDYKHLSVQLAKINLRSYRESYTELEKSLKDIEDSKRQQEVELKKRETAIEGLKKQLLVDEKLLSSRQKSLNEQVNNIRQEESDKKVKGERERFLKERSLNLTDQITQDKEQVKTFADESSQLTELKAEGKSILQDLNKDVKELQERHEEKKLTLREHQQEVENKDNEIQKKQNEVFQFKKNRDVAISQIEALQQELGQMTTESVDHKTRITELQEELEKLASDVDTATKNLDNFKTEKETNDKHIEEQGKQIDDIKNQLALTSRNLDSLQNEYNLTKSLVDNLEGFPEAIKFLNKTDKWSTEAHLVSDIISCQEEYKVAIENYLEQSMNFYVVDDATHALEAVNLLTESSKGKANFYVLNAFKDFKPSKKSPIKGCVAAIDAIEFDEEFRPLISYLFDNVYITDDVSTAPKKPELTFLSQKGNLVKRSYSITGGSIGLFEGKKLGRVKNLEKLQAKIKQVGKEQSEIKSTLDLAITRLNDLKKSNFGESIEGQRLVVNELNQQYVSKRTLKEQLEQIVISSSNKKTDLEQNLTILQKNIDQAAPKIQIEEEQLNQLIKDLEQAKSFSKIESEDLSKRSQEFNQKNLEFHQQKNKIETIQKDISFKISNRDQLEKRIEQSQETLSKTQDEIKTMLSKGDITDTELMALYEEKEAIELGVGEAEKAYYKTRGTISEEEQEVKKLHHKKSSVDEVHIEAQGRLNEIKLELTSVKERMSVEFQVDLDQLMLHDTEDDDKELDVKEIKSALDKVNVQLEKIGPINPMAVEAYDEIKKRFDFITKQKADLTEAKKSLTETIKEIDIVAQENFAESFELIQENFKKVFRSLFTEEDSCSLTLTEPNNPLESSIEIMAKPKGKRPLTINQLSGGEKTLTAVALLFSIYLLKPAPFCIFDEVDAPLDDANIDKFNNIIRKFSAESQFILVTHNKRTMSTTDIIYGVTMLEAGVSRLVPVDLRSLT